MLKAFKLNHLKKVSAHEVELVRALYEFLPATDIRDKFDLAIRKSLIKHLGQDLRYFLSSCEMKFFNEFSATLPEQPLLTVMGLTPIEKKALIQIDHHIANLVINKLLSGSTTMSDLKPLTETEQGVLQYLIMQVLSQVYRSAGSEPRVHFRFEKFIFDPTEAKEIIGSKQRVCILTVEINLFDQSGFVRLIFPDPFLEEMLHLAPGAGRTKKERAYFGRQLKKWGFIKTSAWAEAGSSLLSPVEIKDLEAGDVILFDETDLNKVGKKIAGNVQLHFGGLEGGVKAKIEKSDPKTIKCKLSNVVK
jgi:flagellar motor switch protein FliM